MDLGEILELAKSDTPAPEEPSGGGIATESQIESTIVELAKIKKVDLNKKNAKKLLCSCAHLVQEGATSPKFIETKAVTDYGIELKVSDLRQATKK